MNWIEIDHLLYKIINKHQSIEDIYTEAIKHFKWDRSQAKAAIDPLVSRHSKLVVIAETTKNKSATSKRSRK